MVTAEEIRSRVQAVDEARIQARADAAAKVAEGAERRAAVARELADLDAVLAADVAAAERVMSMAELVDFTGLSERELSSAAAGGTPTRGRSSRRHGTATARSPRARRATASAGDSPAG